MESIEDHENIKRDVHSSAIAVSVVVRDMLLIGQMGTDGRDSSE